MNGLLLRLYKAISVALRKALTSGKIERVEKALTDGDPRHEDLYENCPNMLASVDTATGKIIQCNRTLTEALGCPKENIIGKPVFELYHPDCMENAKEAFQTFLETGSLTDIELQLKRNDGAKVDVLLSVSAFRDRKGIIRYSRSSMRDITERKRLETELRQSEEMFRDLFESAYDVVFMLDGRGNFIHINRRAEVLTGYSRSELRSMKLLEDLVIPEDRPHFRQLMQDVLEGRERIYEVRWQTKAGTIIHFEGASNSRRSARGEFLSTRCILRDITQHKVAEEKIKKHAEELARANLDLERANKVKDEFLNVMSHELRTPLNVVMGYTAMIKDGMLGEINPKQEDALGKVLGRANDQLTMVNNILYATAIEAANNPIETQVVVLSDLFNEIEAAYSSLPTGRNLTLTWESLPDLPALETDRGKLKHILQSLINNAIKFTEKGTVAVSARHILDDKKVVFKVADSGIGMPEDQLALIFEKFRQVDSSETRLYGGVGLGLYIVKKYTELLGGKIEVRSESGKGSIFTVTLPYR